LNKNRTIGIVLIASCILFVFLTVLIPSTSIQDKPIIVPIIEETEGIQIVYNSTIIGKNTKSWYDGMQWIYRWIIILNSTHQRLPGLYLHHEVEIPSYHYDRIEVLDFLYAWKLKGWFSKIHYEVYRNGHRILSW
jgi:hypothetical protein